LPARPYKPKEALPGLEWSQNRKKDDKTLYL
jgi:hypothetical protein